MKHLKIIFFICFLLNINCYSQFFRNTIPTTSRTFSNLKNVILTKGLFNTSNCFIENIGQYGLSFNKSPKLGIIKYGFEGFDLPVLFTSKGIIVLQRKLKSGLALNQKKSSEDEREREAIDEQSNVIDRSLTMEWIGSNPDVTISGEEPGQGYHTYGLLEARANGFRKLIYKNLYPEIDLVFEFINSNKVGFEYKFIVQPGADPSVIKLKFGGDIQQTSIDNVDNFFAYSSVSGIKLSSPKAILCNFFSTIPEKNNQTNAQKLSIKFVLKNKVLSFQIPGNYDKSKTLIIDPFVTSTSNLTGTSAGIAKDIDFDYNGNIYVAGGGGGSTPCKLAKFDANGILQWTFNGTLTTPSWIFGTTYGGWVVEKSTGNIFIGQGIGPFGSQIIRINSAGTFDNYITTADLNFSENWKMLWNCNSGSPQILVAGGGINSNINLGICTPPSVTLNSLNLTGIPTGAQDVADIVIDPFTNDMYTIFASSVITPSINNMIYKNVIPYGPSNVAWSNFSGFPVLSEQKNRPYLTPNVFGNYENSINALAVNISYLFYWDGKNLKAFNKNNGTVAGTPLLLPANTVLMQGGIVADECNNVYIGNTNGIIKVYKFDGNTFNDAAANDITITGFPTSPVYDLAYDQGLGILYACGNGFVASFDISSYCATTVYSLNVTTDCQSLSAQVNINPAPASGNTLTYILYSGTNVIANNNTGLFTGLTLGSSYTVKAFINQACGGTQVIKIFSLINCPLALSTSNTNATCGLSNGSITGSGISGTPPYQYSINGLNYFSSGVFTNLSAGIYTLYVKDAAGTVVLSNSITIINVPGPQLNATSANASCNMANGSITLNAIGGTSPFQYSINGVSFQNNGLFTNLAAGNYNVTIKDFNNCSATSAITISSIPGPVLTATSSPSNCDNNSGSIVCSANGGNAPYTYSIDGITFQQSNMFTGLGVNNYNTSVKDALGCIANFPISVSLNNSLVVDAGNNITICEGIKQQLSASSNGVSFLWSPSNGLSDITVLNPIASPALTTTYTLTTTQGQCNRTSQTTVFVNKAPIADAGKDSAICFGKNIQLMGTGGSSYSWKPAMYLDNSNIFNPIVINPNPGVITYKLSIVDANGCKSLRDDDVTITVTPAVKLYLGNDTSIAINQPLQLYATDVNNVGFVNYLWSPSYGLNNPNIQSPLAILDRNTTYNVKAITASGCIGTDDIKISVFAGPTIYVPNAFTPNGDGLNDLIKAIPIGMQKFNYFIIYNRFGQKIFSTNDPNIGWDGTLKGAGQNSGAFIWMAEAIDYKGVSHKQKGQFVLIR